MARDTKERILEAALELFAQSGYLGTSMSDIAARLGITKAALYKHYTGKQEILDSIVTYMSEMDHQRAAEYDMPDAEPDGFAEAYLHTPIDKIRAYSTAQFDHWTKEPFPANFRKMLTLEQFRSEEMSRLYQQYLVSGPLGYLTDLFGARNLPDAAERAAMLYGAMFLFYGVYDGAGDKKAVLELLCGHIDRFISRMTGLCRYANASISRTPRAWQ